MAASVAGGDVSGAVELAAAGRFREAYDRVSLAPGSRNRVDAAAAVLAAELLYELGNLDDCSRRAHLAINATTSPEELSRAHRVLSRAHFTRGDFKKCQHHLHKSAAYAKESKSDEASARCGLTELLFRISPFDAAPGDLLELKRTVARTGNPHLMIQLRLCVAHREARVESLFEAEKHLNVAGQLLERYPNVWLKGWIDLDRSALASIRGDVEAALQSAEDALSSADVSGHFRTRVAALINTSHALAAQGRYDEAQQRIEVAVRSTADHPHLLLAALESRAELLVAAREYDAAERVFAEMAGLAGPLAKRTHWDQFTESYSKARLAACRGQWAHAAEELESALAKARECGDQLWGRRLELLNAKCLAALDRSRTDPSVLAHNTYEGSLELRAQWCSAVAAISHDPSVSNHFAAQAQRIAEGLGNAVLLHDIALGVVARDSDAGSAKEALLHSSAALLGLAGHPHILAKEVAALIEISKCCSSTALVAVREHTIRVVEVTGWDKGSAGDAARRRSPDNCISVGRRGDEELMLVVQLVKEEHAYCSFGAIKTLVETARRIDHYRREEKQRAALWPVESLDGDPESIWIAEPIAEVVRIARRIAPTQLSVLITGESGTGKEVLARTIHRASDRADKILLPFNCTAVPREMLESQLFGYRRGAFTGADTAFGGVIRAAEGGTLFLDEIADVPLDLQPKLLRVLETHEIHPLGEPHPIKVDVRIIAATNANLEQLVAEGRFREDLYYRLNVIRLRLPPLRERREEIPALVDHFMQRYADQQKKGRLTLSDEALEYLLLYAWPGNIRQLANEVNRMVALAEPHATLTSAHLSAEIQATRRTLPAATAVDSELRVSLDQPLPEAVEYLERMMVQMALDRAKGKVEEAARILGISRKGLFLKRRRWGLNT